MPAYPESHCLHDADSAKRRGNGDEKADVLSKRILLDVFLQQGLGLGRERLAMHIVLKLKAIPRIGKGAISDTYFCPTVMAMPTANPVIIFPPRNWAGFSATKLRATPAAAVTAVNRNPNRQPNQSMVSAATRDPISVMTLYIAFHADCQYAGMMSVPLTLLANVILRRQDGKQCSSEKLRNRPRAHWKAGMERQTARARLS